MNVGRRLLLSTIAGAAAIIKFKNPLNSKSISDSQKQPTTKDDFISQHNQKIYIDPVDYDLPLQASKSNPTGKSLL